MTKNINIELSDEKFENLKEIKEKMGLTWEAFLMMGASTAENLEVRDLEERLAPPIREEAKKG